MNLLTVPNTENLFLEMQFMSRKIYVFLIISMFVCYVKNILNILKSYKFVQPNKNMNVSFVVQKY